MKDAPPHDTAHPEPEPVETRQSRYGYQTQKGHSDGADASVDSSFAMDDRKYGSSFDRVASDPEMGVVDISAPALAVTRTRSHRKLPPTLPATDARRSIASSVTPPLRSSGIRKDSKDRAYQPHEQLHALSRGYPQISLLTNQTHLEEIEQRIYSPALHYTADPSSSSGPYAYTSPSPFPSKVPPGQDGASVQFLPPPQHPTSIVPPLYYQPRDKRMSDIVDSLGSSQSQGADPKLQDGPALVGVRIFTPTPAHALGNINPTNSFVGSDTDSDDEAEEEPISSFPAPPSSPPRGPRS